MDRGLAVFGLVGWSVFSSDDPVIDGLSYRQGIGNRVVINGSLAKTTRWKGLSFFMSNFLVIFYEHYR